MDAARLRQALGAGGHGSRKGGQGSNSPPAADGILSVTLDEAEWRNNRQGGSEPMDSASSSWSDDEDDGPKPTDLYGKFTWKIESFSEISKRELRSNVFEVGNYKWYILVYPQGCDVCNHLSLFLCVADYDKLLPGWSHFAQFTIAVVNRDPKKSKYSDTLHRFCKKEHDWGWKKFMELSKVLDGFTVSDTLVIKAQVQVIRDRVDRPFRCLDPQYRRELVRVYLTNVEGICRRFVDERREKLARLRDDMDAFRGFWNGLSERERESLSSERADVVFKAIVKRFFNEKEVTSTLVMDALHAGCRVLEVGQQPAGEDASARAPAVSVDRERNTFFLGGGVVQTLERAPDDLLPIYEEKELDEYGKDSVERDEHRLADLGRKTVEMFVLSHLLGSRIEVAFRESEALKRQEALIAEEEEAERLEEERNALKAAAEREKRNRKKEKKQRKKQQKEAEEAALEAEKAAAEEKRRKEEEEARAARKAREEAARLEREREEAEREAARRLKEAERKAARKAAREAKLAEERAAAAQKAAEREAAQGQNGGSSASPEQGSGGQAQEEAGTPPDSARANGDEVSSLRAQVASLQLALAERDAEVSKLRAAMKKMEEEREANLAKQEEGWSSRGGRQGSPGQERHANGKRVDGGRGSREPPTQPKGAPSQMAKPAQAHAGGRAQGRQQDVPQQAPVMAYAAAPMGQPSVARGSPQRSPNKGMGAGQPLLAHQNGLVGGLPSSPVGNGAYQGAAMGNQAPPSVSLASSVGKVGAAMEPMGQYGYRHSAMGQQAIPQQTSPGSGQPSQQLPPQAQIGYGTPGVRPPLGHGRVPHESPGLDDFAHMGLINDLLE